MTDSIPNEKSDFNQLPSSASGWATQRNNAWFYVSPRIVPLSEAKDFWKLSAATDKSLILDTYFLTNTRWVGQNRPPHHVIYKNEKGVSINSICWGTVGKDSNGKQQIYTNWVQPVVVHFTTTDAYINCIQLSNRSSETGNICAGNRNPGVNNDPHFTDNDFIHWNSDLIQKMGSSHTIAYWLQDIPDLYNCRDFYLIVPANSVIQLGLKALDYTSYIGGVVIYGEDAHKSTPTKEWLEPNFRSVSWGGLSYVPVINRIVNDDSYIHNYQLKETPIYSNTNTNIKTYTNLLVSNGLYWDTYLSNPITDPPNFKASDFDWFYGLRNPYGTYNFAKNSNNIADVVESSKIASSAYSTYGLLGKDDKIFVQGTPITNTNASIDNSVILVKPDGETNVGTRFYSNAISEDPCTINFAIPRPQLCLITSDTPAKYVYTNDKSYATTQFYAWGNIGTKVYPNILKFLGITVHVNNNTISGTLFNPHDRVINYRWGYDSNWGAASARQPYTHQSWTSPSTHFNTTGAKWRIYKLQAQLANGDSNAWETVYTYGAKNSKLYTINFTVGTGRTVELEYREVRKDGSYDVWHSLRSGTTSCSLCYGDQIRYQTGYKSNYSDGTSTVPQGPVSAWTSITVTGDKTITISNASHVNLEVTYGRNLENVDVFNAANNNRINPFIVDTNYVKCRNSFWIPVNTKVKIHYCLNSSSWSYNVPKNGWSISSDAGCTFTHDFDKTITAPETVNEASTSVYVSSYSVGYLLEYKIGTYSDWFSWGEKKALIYSNNIGKCYVKNSSPSGTSNTTIGSYTYKYRSGGSSIASRFGGYHANNSGEQAADYYKGNSGLSNGQHTTVGSTNKAWAYGSTTLDPTSFQIYFYNQSIGSWEPSSFSNFYNNRGPSGHGARYLLAYETTRSYYYSYTTKNAY